MALSQIGPGRLEGLEDPTSARSASIPDAGTVRRYAGSTTALVDDLARAAGRRLFGDLSAYTPQRPGGPAEPPPADDEIYTRDTIGLYVSEGPTASRPLTESEADRLRQLLARFLPINIRAVLILAPSTVAEAVYPPGIDIGETYRDEYPFIEVANAVTDASADAAPDWRLFLSNVAARRTASVADLITMRSRTAGPYVPTT